MSFVAAFSLGVFATVVVVAIIWYLSRRAAERVIGRWFGW